jgi:hypothetical protein
LILEKLIVFHVIREGDLIFKLFLFVYCVKIFEMVRKKRRGFGWSRRKGFSRKGDKVKSSVSENREKNFSVQEPTSSTSEKKEGNKRFRSKISAVNEREKKETNVSGQKHLPPTKEKKKEKNAYVQNSSLSMSPRSAEEWRLYLLNKYGGHTTQCHFFGIRRGCMGCWDEYDKSRGQGFFAQLSEGL